MCLWKPQFLNWDGKPASRTGGGFNKIIHAVPASGQVPGQQLEIPEARLAGHIMAATSPLTFLRLHKILPWEEGALAYRLPIWTDDLVYEAFPLMDLG